MNIKLATMILVSTLCLNAAAASAAENASAVEPKPGNLPASAQPQTDDFFLTLTQAIEIAEALNHDILMAQQKITDAQLQITEVSAVGLPQLTAGASYGRQDPILSQQSTDTSAGGAAGGLGSNPQFAAFLGTASVNTFSSNVTLNQVLFNGFRVLDGIRIAQINLESQGHALRQTRQNVVFQVSNAYFNALRAHEMILIDQDNLKQIQEQMRVAEVKLKAGAGLKIDVLQAQSQMLQLQQKMSQDLNSYEKAKMSLNQVMGRNLDHPIELNTLATVKDYVGDSSQHLQIALDHRSDLRQIKLQKEMSEMNASLQARAIWPTLSAQVRYSLQDNSVVNGNNRSIQNVNYGLNLNWPIFDGFAAQAKSQRAQQAASQAQLSFDQMQQRVILEIQQAMMDLQEAKERELLAKESVQVAQENFRLASISYKEGVGLMLNILSAQTNLQQAQSAVVNARFDLNTRKARLYQALGLDIIDQLR